MEKDLASKENDGGLKILLIGLALIYSLSFLPGGQLFDYAKANYRSNKGPQPMHLTSGSEFFQGLANSFSEIYVGYGVFTKVFNQKAGEEMIVDAATSSYKEPYQSTTAWSLGKGLGFLLRFSLLIWLAYKAIKM